MRRMFGGMAGLVVVGLLAAPSAPQADDVDLREVTPRPEPGAGPNRGDRGQEHPCRGRATQPSADGAIDGTEGRDVLIGTDRPDVIIAKGGDDILCGLGHTDILAAGPGSDTIYGGDGGDADLSGAGGDDTIFGGGGGGEIYPGGGDDIVDGGGGEANVYFQRSGGPVTVNLAKGWSKGQGTDKLSEVDGAWGTDRDDRLIGSSADNLLFGGRGEDVLLGRGGNDVLLGAQGSDRARGGSGRDRCAGERERNCELGFPEIPQHHSDRRHRRQAAVADEPEEVRRVGVEHATVFCRRLLDGGAPGLHFYAMNKAAATLEVCANLGWEFVPAGYRPQ